MWEPDLKRGGRSTFKVTLSYTRYALSALATVAFALAYNGEIT